MKRWHRNLHRALMVVLALASAATLLFAYLQRLETPIPDPIELEEGSTS